MAPTRPHNKKARSRQKNRSGAAANGANNARRAKQLLAEATALLEQGDVTSALRVAKDAVETAPERLEAEARTLLGEVLLEVGDSDAARTQLLQAAEVDVEEDAGEWWDALIQGGSGAGAAGGINLGARAEKYLWLAQLSEDGGADSVRWLERGAGVLRAALASVEERGGRAAGLTDAQKTLIDEARRDLNRRLSSALCAVAEVYMTDLSWEADAEQRCEALITEATMLAPDLADAWQTVANVRISQGKPDEARTALTRSMDPWWSGEDDAAVPPFPTRVSLVRLLLEVEWEDRAIEVAERLIKEDDSSVEVLYLGGFGQFLIGEKLKAATAAKDDWKTIWASARRWLKQCLTLFAAQEYEDDRLGQHAQELLGTLNKELGEAADDDDDDDDGWEDDDDEEGDGDKVMG
ncbi:hypothetical protein PpBr36_05381 [Pyricularia pennisetigena]|uniref:hypothetical protein n=1 Tax=Pyricularia pennisetigena TaxID=1578925 RepID=UPI001153B594|nr:hypothetical protein PpBr36_05381 [Pyricularia pennisetigena]TLS26715.1 hypothetical protein PpBr36_05381 [Pyricularia pennisetigena]